MSALTDIPFHPFGFYTTIPMFYSAPTQTHTEVDVERFITRLTPLQTTPWIWILDCRASWITLNPVVINRLKHVFEQQHASSLQTVWVVNISGWMRGLFGMLTAGTKKVRFLPSEPLELFVTMTKEGYPSDVVAQLLEVLDVKS